MSAAAIQEYQTKKDEVIAKFSKEFFGAYYLKDPTPHAIVEYLIRGADPYEIIEQLIVQRKEIHERYQWLVENSTTLLTHPK